MIQFLGLHLNARAATAVSLGRDLSLWAEAETPMVNVTSKAEGVQEIPPTEWVRAGCFALQEAYFQLPVKSRKIWGIAPSGPSGWIALDVSYEPISPLRLVPGARVRDDLTAWIDQNKRVAAKIASILSPKDYFRFTVSGGLATDATEVDRLGMIHPGRCDWSDEAIDASPMTRAWLPPVFDSHIPTGRLTEDGMRRTSLPGGCWVVAGAHEAAVGWISVADIRQPVLWVESPATPSDQVEDRRAALGVASNHGTAPPPGWTSRRAAIIGYKTLESPITSKAGLDEAAAIDALRSQLTGSGFVVNDVMGIKPRPALGVAALAGIGSDLVKGWKHYYRALDDSPATPAKTGDEGTTA